MEKSILRVFYGFCVLLLCCAVVLCGSRRINSGSGMSPAGVIAHPARYTVKEYNGSIGVFYDESEKPTLVYEIPVYTLPPADRELLANGITADSSDELEKIIEDYTG